MVKTMAKLRMAHASTHGARKPPGPRERERERERLNNGDNNGQIADIKDIQSQLLQGGTILPASYIHNLLL